MNGKVSGKCGADRDFLGVLKSVEHFYAATTSRAMTMMTFSTAPGSASARTVRLR